MFQIWYYVKQNIFALPYLSAHDRPENFRIDRAVLPNQQVFRDTLKDNHSLLKDTAQMSLLGTFDI